MSKLDLIDFNANIELSDNDREELSILWATAECVLTASNTTPLNFGGYFYVARYFARLEQILLKYTSYD